MRTYLVTGGAGFIGSNYIHYMFRKYGDTIRIINVDVLTYAGNLENLKDIENNPNYTFIRADITDKEAIAKIFAENDIDRVVHFAAESHVDRSIKNPEVFVKTNVLGTAVMLNCAKAAWELPDGTFKADKKFLHVSTDEVYGSLEDDGSYFYETTPYAPHSPYSASKASSDMLVKAYIDEKRVSGLMVIHDVNLALRYCNRFLFMKHGGVLGCGGPEIVTSKMIQQVYEMPASVEMIKERKIVMFG